jgi:hypothetical protein
VFLGYRKTALESEETKEKQELGKMKKETNHRNYRAEAGGGGKRET